MTSLRLVSRRVRALPVGLPAVWFLAWPLTMAIMVANVPPTRLRSDTPGAAHTAALAAAPRQWEAASAASLTTRCGDRGEPRVSPARPGW